MNPHSENVSSQSGVINDTPHIHGRQIMCCDLITQRQIDNDNDDEEEEGGKEGWRKVRKEVNQKEARE